MNMFRNHDSILGDALTGIYLPGTAFHIDTDTPELESVFLEFAPDADNITSNRKHDTGIFDACFYQDRVAKGSLITIETIARFFATQDTPARVLYYTAPESTTTTEEN